MAALSPSGKQLARAMLQPLDVTAKRVIELGGGTGAFTRAILQYGIQPDQLMVLELNAALHQHLLARFPDSHVVCGDARDLADLAARVGYSDDGPADAVISGLGLLAMSRGLQRDILKASFELLAPEGQFIQFTYGPTSPVSREVLDGLGLKIKRTGFALLNVPPASVYSITRQRSQSVPARRKGKSKSNAGR